jgi:hypothetical protein
MGGVAAKLIGQSIGQGRDSVVPSACDRRGSEELACGIMVRTTRARSGKMLSFSQSQAAAVIRK